MSVISTFLPGKSNFAIAQAAASAEDQVQRHGDRRGQQRERSADSAIGSRERRDVGGPALLERLGEDGHERHAPGRAPRKASATRDQEQPAPSAARVERRACARGRTAVVAATLSAPGRALQACSRLIASSSTKEATSITDGDGGRARVVVLLELGDDEQRRDLGLHRHVARDEDDRSVLAERAREGQRDAGEPGREAARAARRARRSAPRVAPRLAAASSTSGSSSSSTGCSVRTTNGRPMKVSASVMPSGVKATLMPSARERRARASRSARRAS